jgi:hypothetical protein
MYSEKISQPFDNLPAQGNQEANLTLEPSAPDDMWVNGIEFCVSSIIAVTIL